MGIFSSKLNIAKGTYNLNKVSGNPILKSDVIKDSKNPEMMNALFNLFDVDGGQDGILTSYEQCRMVDVFKQLDTDGDNKLSKQEFADATVRTKLDGETLREFFMKVMKSMKKSEKVDANEVRDFERKIRGIEPEETEKVESDLNSAENNSSTQTIDETSSYATEEDTKTEVDELQTDEASVDIDESEELEVAQENVEQSDAEEDYASNSSAIESQVEKEGVHTEDAVSEKPVENETQQKEEATVKENEVKLHDYTVQMNETFTNIIKKSLAAQGNTNPSASDIEAAKEEFRQNNPNAIKKTKSGYEYLLVGAKVKLSGNVENKNNSKEQIAAWASRYGNQTPKTANSVPVSSTATSTSTKSVDNETLKVDNTEAKSDTTSVETNTRLTSDVIKDKNGNVTGIIKRSINEEGKVVEETRLDKDGQPVEKTNNTYSNSGFLVSKKISDGQGNVKQTIEYLYYEDGREAQRTYKDKDGNITGIAEVNYEIAEQPDVVKSELLKDADGKKLGGVVQYNDGKMSYYHYNKDGNPTYMYTRDKDGKTVTSARFEYYDNGFPQKGVYITEKGTEYYTYNKDGSYEYSVSDSENKFVKLEYADKDGNPITSDDYKRRQKLN